MLDLTLEGNQSKEIELELELARRQAKGAAAKVSVQRGTQESLL